MQESFSKNDKPEIAKIQDHAKITKLTYVTVRVEPRTARKLQRESSAVYH